MEASVGRRPYGVNMSKRAKVRETSMSLPFHVVARRTSPCLMLIALMACRGTELARNDTGGPNEDSGTTIITCTTMQDCGGQGICVGGICESVTPCSADSECSEGICHSTRGYCVECDGRHQGECAQGFTCQFDFTCVSTAQPDAGMGDASAMSCSGMCTDRTECGAGQVCSGGMCCPPPARCFTPDDCPSNRPDCNGATGECFGGDDCFSDAECATRPGCGGGACRCDAPQVGQPGVCRVAPDACQGDVDCAMGEFCTVMSSPRVCVSAPACTMDSECANLGLVCNTAQMICQNGTPCPMGNECNPATQACVAGVCTVQDCLNTPSLCGPNETCEPAIRQCIPNPLGPCPGGQVDCSQGYWCNDTISPAQCEFGCSDNADCPGGICNAAHQCESMMPPPGGGQVCGPCTADADCPAGSRCVNAPLGMLCYETCSSITGDMCDERPGAMCVFGNCSCVL